MLAAALSPPRFVTLILLAALSTVSLNMFLPSLAVMSRDLQTDYAVISISIAGYLAVTAVLQLIIGPLSDRYGRRPVMLVSLIVFLIASLICAVVSDIVVFLSARLLQGAIIAGWVLSLSIIRDLADEREAASRIGYVTMAMAVAPALGPMFGGLLEQLFGWRASFTAFAAMGAMLFAWCWVDLGETNHSPSPSFSKQVQSYPELLRSQRFWGYSLSMAFTTSSFYVFLAGVPLVAATVLKLSPAALGICIGSITVGFMFGGFLSGRFARFYPLAVTMLAGRFIACGGLIAGLVLFRLGIINVYSLFGATLFVGIGNGLTMPAGNAGAMSVRPRIAGSASGLSGALIVALGAAFSFLTGIVLSSNANVYSLFAIMLFCAAVSLAATLYVHHAEKRHIAT